MSFDTTGLVAYVNGEYKPVSEASVSIFDTTKGQTTGSATVVGDTDDLFYDAAKQRLYVVGGEAR